jgi:hypothetical protein
MALTYRTGSDGKDSALTIDELDNNFRHFTGSHAITGSLTVSSGITSTGGLTTTGSVDLVATSILMVGLPTSDPAVTGQLWNDAGTVKVSL